MRLRIGMDGMECNAIRAHDRLGVMPWAVTGHIADNQNTIK
ncbi:MAG: hypothetical protein PUK16_03815 [Prevotellaceae bacterium]|nr:hypothetical protein [Prevotellaceae bacterium]MDY2634453.1 hypothetical protein [Prevotella sp.]